MATPRRLRTVRIVSGSCLLCAWCGWASGLRHSTAPAFAAWAASLLAVSAVDVVLWQRGRKRSLGAPPGNRAEVPRHPRGGLLRFSPWLALLLVAVAWEILGIDTGPHVPHLTISSLAQAYRAVDAALMLVWMLVGLGYGVARAEATLRKRPRGKGPRRPAAGGLRAGSPPGVVVLASLPPEHSGLRLALLLPASRPVGLAFWLCWLSACLVTDFVARRSRGLFADAVELLQLISRPRLARLVLVAAWAYAGWHLFAH